MAENNKIIMWRYIFLIYNYIFLRFIQNTSGVQHVYKNLCLTAMVLQLLKTPELLKLWLTEQSTTYIPCSSTSYKLGKYILFYLKKKKGKLIKDNIYTELHQS